MTHPPALALDHVARLIGDRWSMLVLDALRTGPRRYGALAHLVPGISSNLLAARLRDLTAAGLLIGRPYSSRRDRLEYELSDAGQQLAEALAPLRAWGAQQNPSAEDAPRHDFCGAPLAVRWYCPSCDVDVSPDNEQPDSVRLYRL